MKTEMRADNSKFVGLCPTGSEKVIIGKEFALLVQDRIPQEEADAKLGPKWCMRQRLDSTS
eukprot:4573517-Amphidinium_carterae.1